jgi:RNA-directed DNA polymerase
MIQELNNLKDYYPNVVKRVYIPKNDTKKRPLGIPTIKDRCVQTLFLFTLEPIAEANGEERSYGFRKYRSTQDAQKYIRLCLANKDRAKYILDGDIKGFFDNINHEWILNNIPIDKVYLKKILSCGILDKGVYKHSTGLGVPQGGIISPIIANMVLDGLGGVIKKYREVLDKELKKEKKESSKINYVRYADDFLITSSEIKYLEGIKPKIEEFLTIIGLVLNKEKTKIYNINKGFDFLGFNFRKYRTTTRNNNKILLIKPTEMSIRKVKEKIIEIFNTFMD